MLSVNLAQIISDKKIILAFEMVSAVR
jgi:hypothetical protein